VEISYSHEELVKSMKLLIGRLVISHSQLALRSSGICRTAKAAFRILNVEKAKDRKSETEHFQNPAFLQAVRGRRGLAS
jgi:hypothetical protein